MVGVQVTSDLLPTNRLGSKLGKPKKPLADPTHGTPAARYSTPPERGKDSQGGGSSAPRFPPFARCLGHTQLTPDTFGASPVSDPRSGLKVA